MNLIEIPENDKDTAYHYRNYLFLIHNKNECIAESIFTAMSADFVDADTIEYAIKSIENEQLKEKGFLWSSSYLGFMSENCFDNFIEPLNSSQYESAHYYLLSYSSGSHSFSLEIYKDTPIITIHTIEECQKQIALTYQNSDVYLLCQTQYLGCRPVGQIKQ